MRLVRRTYGPQGARGEHTGRGKESAGRLSSSLSYSIPQAPRRLGVVRHRELNQSLAAGPGEELSLCVKVCVKQVFARVINCIHLQFGRFSTLYQLDRAMDRMDPPPRPRQTEISNLNCTRTAPPHVHSSSLYLHPTEPYCVVCVALSWNRYRASRIRPSSIPCLVACCHVYRVHQGAGRGTRTRTTHTGTHA